MKSLISLTPADLGFVLAEGFWQRGGVRLYRSGYASWKAWHVGHKSVYISCASSEAAALLELARDLITTTGGKPKRGKREDSAAEIVHWVSGAMREETDNGER